MTAEVNVLVVDDELSVCHTCTRILQRQGYHVDAVTDPHEGLRLARSGHHHAIILDVRMPELSGIEFLRILRETHPSLPVIIMSAYSSLACAAEAVRLHAANFVPKPFSDTDLADAVKHVLAGTKEHSRVESKSTHKVVCLHNEVTGPNTESQGYLFLDAAWATAEPDGRTRVGAFLGREEARYAEAFHVARVGDVVHRGLPLAEVTIPGRRKHVIPSPVTGEVVEVNPALTTERNALWSEPCKRGWLALIQTHQPCGGRPRRLVLLCQDDRQAALHSGKLADLGCQVVLVKSLAAALQALRAARSPLLVAEATSLGEKGPELINSIHHAVPRTTLVVLAEPGDPWEAAYRSEAITSYAVDAYANGSILDVLDLAFRPANSPTAIRGPAALPGSLRAIRVRNRHGQTVSLLTHGDVLLPGEGLGRAILQRLQDGAHPLRITLGPGPLSSMEIWAASHDGDRVILLIPESHGRIPGSLTPTPGHPLAQEAKEAAERVLTLLLEPGANKKGLPWFDEMTTDSMAELLVEMMTSPS